MANNYYNQPAIINRPEPAKFPSGRFLLILVGILIINSLIGFWAARTFIAAYPLPKEQINLPVSQELLQNPIFSNWTAHIKGRVVAKTNDSFTIAQIIEEYNPDGSTVIKDADGKTMEIANVTGRTVFKKDPGTKNVQDASQVSLPDIQVGSIVSGTVEIQKSAEKWLVVGRNFFINE